MALQDIARSIVNRTGEFGGNVQELAKNILDKQRQRQEFFNQNPEAQKAVNRMKPPMQRAVEFIGKTYLYNPEEKKLFPSSPVHTIQDMMNIQQQRQSGELSEQEARKQLSDKALNMAMVVGELSPSPKAVNNQAARALKMLEEQAKKFDSADDFVNSITQEDLLDLANRDTQRFGRAFNIDKDMNLDGNQLLEEYGDDLRLSEPETYNKLAGDGNTVTVYRAVPKNTESVKNQLTKEMAQIQKTGKIPDSPFVDEFNNSEYFGKFGNSINKQKSAYYEFISDKLDNLTDATGKNYSIDVGDYITLNKNYAIEHGQSNLNNLYDIKTKTVPKKDIIWDGNDFNEWIYSPQKLRDKVGNLTDFYNKATQPQPPKAVNNQASQALDYIRSGDQYGKKEIGITQVDDMVARERFDLSKLKKISSGGSDRDVYDLGDGKVLKVSKSARGLAQNTIEGEPYAPVPKSFESGKNYVVVEKANPPNEQTKKLVKELKKLDVYQLNDERAPNHYEEVQKAMDILNKYDVDGDSLANYNVMWNDLLSIRNWGTDADGLPIHVDAGTFSQGILDDFKGVKNLNDPEFRDVYYQSKKAKKKFGDLDKNTMYGLLAPILGITALKRLQKEDIK